MIDILLNFFNSLNIYLFLFVTILLYFINKKSSNDELAKVEKEAIIGSIERRSEECPQQYPNGWLPIYDSHDLKKGQVKPIFALGRDLVIYRGTSGKVYVFDAYCPHLGANLGVGGTVVGDDIKCHFHGWKYNNQGECNNIPGLDDKSIPKATIRKWRCDEVNDFIYVWHHLDGNEPDWFISRSEKLDSFVYRGKIVLSPYCHIQDIPENEVDFVHFDTVHGTESLFPKFLHKMIKYNVICTDWKICAPPDTHCTQTTLISYFKVFGLTLASIQLVFKTIGPANMLFDIHLDMGFKLDFVTTINIITLGHMKQLIVPKWYSEPSIIGFIFGKVMIQFFGIVFGPDVPIWNYKRFVRSPIITELDEPIVCFRRWYQQFYSDHSKIN